MTTLEIESEHRALDGYQQCIIASSVCSLIGNSVLPICTSIDSEKETSADPPSMGARGKFRKL
jgi:hypothetical protein